MLSRTFQFRFLQITRRIKNYETHNQNLQDRGDGNCSGNAYVRPRIDPFGLRKQNGYDL